MKVILFGATGMVGQGVLRECLADPEISMILSVVRKSSGFKHDKFKEVIHLNFLDFTPLEKELTGFDACFFCLGASSSRMTEEAYRQLTYGFTVAAGQTLSRLNPAMTMVFVSGEGTDETGTSRVIWARVKGEAENALRQMPFKAAYMFRPGYIQPLDGIVSRERIYRYFYAVMAPLYPVWKVLFPSVMTNTRLIGQAMIQVAKKGSVKTILRSADINAAAQK